jgi:hypothetical protein
MHFGENVREVVSMSCGRDLRGARSRTVLPGIDSPAVQQRLAANLERSFDITQSPEDVSPLTTLRAVLQCVRLRRWERDMEEQARDEACASTAAVAVAASGVAALPPGVRDRFVRYTPPTQPLPIAAAAAAAFAIRKS